MKLCRDVLVLGVGGAILGMHIYMFMSPKCQKEIERGLKKAVHELRDLTHEMARITRGIG